MSRDVVEASRRRGQRGRIYALPIGLLVAGALLLVAAFTWEPQPPTIGADLGPVASTGAPDGDRGDDEPDVGGPSTRRDAPPAGAATAGSASGQEIPASPDRSELVPDTPAPAPAEEPAQPAAEPVAIEVPSIGVSSELIELDLDEQRRLEVPRDPDVAGWYVRAPKPGEPGAAVIAGHVDSQDGPAVFWRLPELQAGDRITVHRADDTRAVFEVDDVGRWPKDDFPTDAVYRNADGPELRLITCGGVFDREQRSYRDNIVVFASLVAEEG